MSRAALARPRRAATVAGAGLLALTLLAAPARAADRPLPTPAGFVSDFANVLDPATKAALEARIEELKRKTGSEIAVVTVKTTAPDTAFDYAMRLAEAWKPGAPGKDNGVVFLVSVDDREMFIATGYGIEGALPDGLVGEIRDRDVLPHFRAGDLSGGVRAGVERIAAIIAREYGVELSGSPAASPPRGARRGPDLSPLALVLLLLVVFVVVPALTSGFTGGRRRRGYWGGGGPMWGGGFGGGGFGGPGGGFGGFGGGGFGGGGAGGKW